MTPKEKAKELVDKYFIEIQGADRYSYNLPSMNLFIAKKCALIAVNEIINSYSNYTGMYDQVFFDSELEYFKQVKQEIEKL